MKTVEPRRASSPVAFRSLAAVERVGNKLPDPFWLFWLLALGVVVLSAVLSATGFSVVQGSTGKSIAVRNLLSADGLVVIVDDAMRNFASFPPLPTIVAVMLGISVADRSGFISTLLRRMVARVSGRYLTFALSLTAMVGHIAGDAAYVTLIPIGAMAFCAANRSPVLGCVVAFVSISAGYDASPSLTTTDALLSGITTAAAQTVDPNYTVTPVANYFFGLASSVLIALVITVVVETVLARRPDLAVDQPSEAGAGDPETAEPTGREQRALRVTGLVAVAFVAALVVVMIPAGSPLRGPGGGVVTSPLFTGMAPVLGLFFAMLGVVYGRLAGTLTRAPEIVAAMTDGVRSLAPTLVLFFAISQFLAYFKWTNIGEILAVSGAETLRGFRTQGWLVLIGIAVVVTVMNLLVTSGSALWSLVSPVFVPMLMLIGIAPEATQAVYRVADSATNCITPMSPYFLMALRFIQTYRKSAGIGTLASFTLPLAGAVWLVWICFFTAWYLLGIPFGPGA
ncbi:AbgT family transporter [Streptomyces malaysiensis]|uniref:AbgT family transporter n=1 Tax=Streptomyces malaysiensis subsp. samsunensis TaxID=459658 RepID=A0A9X2RY55_STRMQ|nr:AbgT family transporter [Streptomyces samsunensis]MCQ8834853.1 AbgT family transporter [Streptomyces samsunensis]